MKVHPLESISLEEAKRMQFKLLDIISQHFTGREFLSSGDLGNVPGLGRPQTTARVEKVIAAFFGAEDAALVRAAGTGAIRCALQALVRPGDTVLIHDAPPFATTAATFEWMGLNTVSVNFNCQDDVLKALDLQPKLVYMQHSRQRLADSYDLRELIHTIRSRADVPIITDENYTALKTPYIGVEAGATLSAFSLFKLLGPEGVGCVVGQKEAIDRIHKINYSGGGQVQGHEAMEALRALAYVPVMHAIESEEMQKVIDRLNRGEVSGITGAWMVNGQNRVILAQLDRPIAKKVVENADRLGAATHPVGAESKYEIIPLVYRVSGTFLKENPDMEDYFLRISPSRASGETVIRILKEAIRQAGIFDAQGNRLTPEGAAEGSGLA